MRFSLRRIPFGVMLALLGAGCGKVRYAAVGDGATEASRGDRGVDLRAPDLLTFLDAPDPGCAGAPAVDGDEPNNDCASARREKVSDSDSDATELRRTIYPAGDLDYVRVTAEESDKISIPPCLPGDAQCLSLELTLVQPAVAGLLYQYTLLTGSCSAPTSTTTKTATYKLQWDGKCGQDDSRDFWIKVEATASSKPACAGLLYKLQIRMKRDQDKC